MAKRLFIDLDICDEKCKECVVECSYFYHPWNNGITELREKATYMLICRKCESPTCVPSCPEEALKKGEDGILIRSSMKCIKCHTCVLACPFGTLHEDTVPFLRSSCDLCVGRADGKVPICVETCPYGALKYEEMEEDPEEGIYLIRENVLAHATAWKRE